MEGVVLIELWRLPAISLTSDTMRGSLAHYWDNSGDDGDISQQQEPGDEETTPPAILTLHSTVKEKKGGLPHFIPILNITSFYMAFLPPLRLCNEIVKRTKEADINPSWPLVKRNATGANTPH